MWLLVIQVILVSCNCYIYTTSTVDLSIKHPLLFISLECTNVDFFIHCTVVAPKLLFRTPIDMLISHCMVSLYFSSWPTAHQTTLCTTGQVRSFAAAGPRRGMTFHPDYSGQISVLPGVLTPPPVYVVRWNSLFD